MLRIVVFLGVRSIALAIVLFAAINGRAEDPDPLPQDATSDVASKEPIDEQPAESELLQPASFQVQGDPSNHRYVFLDSSGQLPPEPKPFPTGAEHSVLLTNPDDAGRETEADDATDRTAAANVSTEEELVTRAVQLAKKADTIGEFTRVIHYCQKAAKLRGGGEPSEFVVRLAAWAANRRGELAIAEGDEGVALASFQQAVEMDDGCWQAVHNRGVSLAIEGDLVKALSDFTRAIDLNPNFAPAYRNRGELRIGLGLLHAAIEDYTKAIELTPDDAALYRIRGHAEHRRGAFVAAVRDFNLAIKKDPRNASAYTDRGNVYAELGYYRQSLKDFRQALRADERYRWAYRSVAWVLATCPDEQYRRPDKAIVAAQRAIALATSVDPLDFDVLAAAHASAGQFEAAVATEEKAIKSAAGSPLAGEFRARRALYEQGKNFVSTPRDRHTTAGPSSAWTDSSAAAVVPKSTPPHRGGATASRPKKPGTPARAGARIPSGGRYQGRRTDPLSPPRESSHGSKKTGKTG